MSTSPIAPPPAGWEPATLPFALQLAEDQHHERRVALKQVLALSVVVAVAVARASWLL